MGRKSNISKLPKDVRELLDAAIGDGRLTIDELRTYLQSLGIEIPRSTLGDYKKRMESKLEKMREAREVAGVWVAQMGEQKDSKTGQLLAELLQTVAFRTLADMQEDDSGTEPMDLMLLANALKDMAGAQKTDQEYREKLRAAWRAEAEERAKVANEEVTKVARSAGLTEDAATKIRELVLGVVG